MRASTSSRLISPASADPNKAGDAVDVRAELAQRQRDRVDWLERALVDWRADDRVVAVWLWGSGGRGTDDALSDWDLFVATDDAASMDLLGGADGFSRFGAVAWVRENEYNAPADGRCFSVGYPAAFEPLAIDWYLQPVSAAIIGTDTRVLLEKTPVPRAESETFALFPNVASQTPYALPTDPAERLGERLAWFWFMFSPIAKWLARRDDRRVDAELAGMHDVLTEAAHFVDHTLPAPPGDADLVSQVRWLADQMTRIHPALSARHVRIPETDTAYQQLDTAQRIHQSGWKP